MRFLTIPFFVLLSFFGYSQQYRQSLGVRLGNTSALTLKNFVAEEEAIELMLSGRRSGMQLTTLYEFHHPLEFSFNENFYVYYGIGGHVGFEKYDDLDKTLTNVDPPEFVYDNKQYFLIGIDGIAGIEYRWLSVPITISFDLKPYFSFIGMRYTNALFWDAGLSFKYIF
jgi:hypothetical protein